MYTEFINIKNVQFLVGLKSSDKKKDFFFLGEQPRKIEVGSQKLNYHKKEKEKRQTKLYRGVFFLCLENQYRLGIN